jgi:hypothetical protein
MTFVVERNEADRFKMCQFQNNTPFFGRRINPELWGEIDFLGFKKLWAPGGMKWDLNGIINLKIAVKR